MNRFTLQVFTYEVDPVLDNLLNKGLNQGIKQVYNEYSINMKIIFNDGSSFDAANKGSTYFEWLKEGKYLYPKDKHGFQSQYNWSQARPTRKTMERLYNTLKQF
ncbi:MAG: hypothetical protein PF487_09070 [Bacteroidales bacterium]|jgi:hypothetical protein|nr:hypothetical protein [Bacteroidales bacterium]